MTIRVRSAGLLALLLGLACGGDPEAIDPDPMTPMEPDGGTPPSEPPTAVMPLATRGIPDPVLHNVPQAQLTTLKSHAGDSRVAKGIASDLPGGAGAVGAFGERVERCVQQGGSLAECGGTAGLCAARDAALGNIGGPLFDKLGLGELGKNYYCDEGCFHCCWVPGGGRGGGGGGCHTSFDTSEGPVVNCNAPTYGAGTVGVGPALIIGDSLGLGICIGGVQQLCNHLAVCNGAGSSSGPGGGSEKARTTKGLEGSAISEPPHEQMTNPDAVYIRVQAFENAMRRNFFDALDEAPASARRKTYVDFITARGAVDWIQAMREIEPYNRVFDEFAVRDDDDQLLEAESYHQGILYHANLAFLGAVPNLVDRLSYVESRYWTEQEKDEYLDGLDPEAELRKTMSPLVFEALTNVPIQDWRLLAQEAPNETPLSYRSYDGFRLGQAPLVTATQDCTQDAAVSLAVAIDDPEDGGGGATVYPVVIDWGDGQTSRHTYDSAVASNVYTHEYAEPGTFLTYVTTANSTGLRGVVGTVVEATEGDADANRAPSIATVSLDDFVVYSPSVSLAGQSTFEVQARRSDGSSEGIGWTDLQTLANAGPNRMGNLIGYNEASTPFETIVLRPFHQGGHFLNSVYFRTPTITVGFFDQRVGAIATHTVPLTEAMARVYYQGADSPVPVGQLERDLNGELLFPVLRENDNLADDFCGAEACEVLDRIEIDLTPDLLNGQPGASPVPTALSVGDTARWVEDVPNVFIPAQASESDTVPGACETSLTPTFVAAGEPSDSLVTSLTINPPSPVSPDGAPVQLRAVATLYDGSTLDVTQHATWHSDDETVLTVSNGADKGELAGSTVAGTTKVSATLGGATASATATHDASARGYQSYRIHFDAVHGNPGRAAITGVELLVDGRVLESEMESEDVGRIGLFPATVESSEGSDPTNAFDVSFATTWSSANDVFDVDEPYAVGDEPVYLQVNFETQVPVNGLRMHRTAGILFVSYGPHFPKTIRVQGSNDGINFTDIDGATVELMDWRGEPAVVEW